MSLLQALVLGIVQGLTEFIPVSSSGHLVLFPFIVGWRRPSVAFDVAVHLGTLVAVLWVFRETIAQLFVSLTRWSSAPEGDRRLIKLLAIATVPAAVAGGVLNGFFESSFERPVLAAFLLGVTGYFLMSAETRAEAREEEPKTEEALEPADAGVIGLAQAVAILPGISRSGATIVAGMRRGFDRAAAARFSFLLSIPVILGATAFKLPDIASEGARGGAGSFVIGFAAATGTGVVAVRWFLGLTERRGLRPFGAYCFLAMTAGLLASLARG